MRTQASGLTVPSFLVLTLPLGQQTPGALAWTPLRLHVKEGLTWPIQVSACGLLPVVAPNTQLWLDHWQVLLRGHGLLYPLQVGGIPLLDGKGDHFGHLIWVHGPAGGWEVRVGSGLSTRPYLEPQLALGQGARTPLPPKQVLNCSTTRGSCILPPSLLLQAFARSAKALTGHIQPVLGFGSSGF